MLDLNAFPDNCGAAPHAGCELELYACYEGQEPPLSTAVLQSAMGLDSYQAEGVTYLGPLSLTLTTVAPDLELHSHGLHQHQPGDTAAGGAAPHTTPSSPTRR